MPILSLLLALGVAAQSDAPLEAARLAYRNGDYKDAAGLALSASAGGEAAAMDLLGDLFREGRGVRKDARTAFGWHLKAAARDYIPALYRVGVYLHEGYGTPPDAKEGLRSILRVGALENPAAQFDGATVDWLGHRATDEGDAHAAFTLAKAVQNGWGVVADKDTAVELYAAAGDHPLAQINLGAMLLENEDDRTPFALFEKAADKGYAIAQYNLGLLFYRDAGPYRDLPRGKKLLETAAAQDFEPAKKELAR